MLQHVLTQYGDPFTCINSINTYFAYVKFATQATDESQIYAS